MNEEKTTVHFLSSALFYASSLSPETKKVMKKVVALSVAFSISKVRCCFGFLPEQNMKEETFTFYMTRTQQIVP